MASLCTWRLHWNESIHNVKKMTKNKVASVHPNVYNIYNYIFHKKQKKKYFLHSGGELLGPWRSFLKINIEFLQQGCQKIFVWRLHLPTLSPHFTPGPPPGAFSPAEVSIDSTCVAFCCVVSHKCQAAGEKLWHLSLFYGLKTFLTALKSWQRWREKNNKQILLTPLEKVNALWGAPRTLEQQACQSTHHQFADKSPFSQWQQWINKPGGGGRRVAGWPALRGWAMAEAFSR